MHDIRAIRDNPTAFDDALIRRGHAPTSSDILQLDTSRRACIQAAGQHPQNKTPLVNWPAPPSPMETMWNLIVFVVWFQLKKMKSPI